MENHAVINGAFSPVYLETDNNGPNWGARELEQQNAFLPISLRRGAWLSPCFWHNNTVVKYDVDTFMAGRAVKKSFNLRN